jgi:hypothetical protein
MVSSKKRWFYAVLLTGRHEQIHDPPVSGDTMPCFGKREKRSGG